MPAEIGPTELKDAEIPLTGLERKYLIDLLKDDLKDWKGTLELLDAQFVEKVNTRASITDRMAFIRQLLKKMGE